MNADPAVVQLPLDAFACHERPAVPAGEKSPGQRHVDLLRRATNLAIKTVTASTSSGTPRGWPRSGITRNPRKPLSPTISTRTVPPGAVPNSPSRVGTSVTCRQSLNPCGKPTPSRTFSPAARLPRAGGSARLQFVQRRAAKIIPRHDAGDVPLPANVPPGVAVRPAESAAEDRTGGAARRTVRDSVTARVRHDAGTPSPSVTSGAQGGVESVQVQNRKRIASQGVTLLRDPTSVGASAGIAMLSLRVTSALIFPETRYCTFCESVIATA